NVNQSQENQFPISDLNQGMYIVKTLNENHKVKEMKLLKQ
ncbi:T9SS type A sorting domain-containing protein, partial [Flavobacterium sp.]